MRRIVSWLAKLRPKPTGPADSMLFRELVADIAQNALKFTAFWLSGSQAMKAELMRASVDTLNHISLLGVNMYTRRPPDVNHNYGYERYKNLVTFLPSTLFLASGIYNIAAPMQEILSMTIEPTLTLTGISLSAIALCSCGEFYLFYKNLGDLDQQHKGSNVLQNFYRRVTLALKILKRRHPADPIQTVVVSENVTSVLGMSLPLLTNFLVYFTGFSSLDQIGCIMNGVVQVYLAWSIFWDNTQTIIGKSLSLLETYRIKTILEDRDGVRDIDDIKSEYISNNSLKIAATVKYDLREITENIVKELEPEISRTSPDPFTRAEVRKITEKSIDQILSYTTEIIQDIESDIHKEFPYITEIDLEQSKDNINKAFEGLIPLTSDEEGKDEKAEQDK